MKLSVARGDEEKASWRLTENQGLIGLLIQERGELIEYISYSEAVRRQFERSVGIPGSLARKHLHCPATG